VHDLRERAHKAWPARPEGDWTTVALTWIRTHDWDIDEWRDRAACRDTNPEMFFPIGTTGMAVDQIDAAKRICSQCPVAHECLEFALATNQEAGVWGGTTEDERRKHRKTWLAEQRFVV
jgi:WhiB family redox-sensing transcriptional regulator